MFRTIGVGFLVIAILGAPAFAQPSAREDLARPARDWAQNWQAKNLNATLALYTDDAVFMDATGSRIAGKQALQKFFTIVLRQYNPRPSLHSVANGSSGNLGYDWGEYSEVVTPTKDPKGAIEAHGTYLEILRKVSGRWLIQNQMWTGNVPVPVNR